MKDFIPFEIAIKLREKGFREECIAYYHTDGELLYNRDQYRGGNYKSLLRSYNSLPKNPIGCEQIDAPTISQVLKWLREEKKIHITVEIDNNGWYYTVSPNVRLKNSKLKIISFENKESYEQATLVGIQYILYNLI